MQIYGLSPFGGFNKKTNLMKNYITLFIILLLGRNTAVAQESKEAVLHRLNQTIEQSATYIQAKEQRITSLKKALKKASQPTEKYDLHKQLYTEYRKFKVDSAVAYLLKNEQLAIALNVRRSVATAKSYR